MAKPSIEELRRQLAEAEQEEKQERQEKRVRYESERSDLVNELCSDAFKLAVMLTELKTDATHRLNAFRGKMLEYGDLRGGENNKGSFEIKNDDWKIQFTSQIVKKFDERALAAEKHISEFLKSFLRKKDKPTYNLISNLLKRDEESGQFDIDMINRLYSMEDQFDDPNWVEGIRLFKESYSPDKTAQYVRFYQKNESTGAWDNLILDFAKVRPVTEIAV